MVSDRSGTAEDAGPQRATMFRGHSHSGVNPRIYRRKSLFRNILRISALNSKIWRDVLPKLLIPKDRDMGGRGVPVSRWLTT